MDQPAQVIIETVPPPVPVATNPQPLPPSRKANKFPLIFLVLLGLILAGGLVYAGIQIGKKQLPGGLVQIPIDNGPVGIELSPTPDVTSGWKTFLDPEKKLQFSYPADYSLTSRGSSYWLLNRKINWYISKYSFKNCVGDCPIITQETAADLGILKGSKIKGWIGDIGGGPAQSFIGYEIEFPQKGQYFRINLWELPQDLTQEERKLYLPGRKINQPSAEEEQIFDQILATFRFD